MSAGHELEQARSLGIVISARGEKLRFGAPAGTLTPQLRQALAVNKKAILDILEADRLAKLSQVQDHNSSYPIADFAAALRSGVLQQCHACRHFTGDVPPDGDTLGVLDAGWCRRYDTATHPQTPFWCYGYEQSAARDESEQW